MAIEKFTVARDDSIYEAWPDVLQTESGKLICVFTECNHHLDRDNSRIMLTESLDRGRTWSPKRPLTEKCPGGRHYNCARISRLRDGRLAILCDRIAHDENEGSEIHLWFANPEGECWDGPILYPFRGIVPDKLLQLENGRLIIAAHFMNKETEKLEQYLWYSDDGGTTWSDRVTVAADSRYNLCEVSIVPVEEDTLVAFLRENSHAGYDMMKVFSHDNGQTWSPVYPTPVDCGHRPVAGFLQDGRVMVTYRFIPRGTQNVFAAFFPKDALLKTDRQAQNVRIMPLDYDRNPAPDLGYTGWTQFADGEIYVVNYIKDDADKAYIRGYSFYPNDVTLPETDQATPNVF